jgi:signal transduction histidine kinase/DNA-binding response OmpR family regulator/ligand-binding sensor domain-containing protein
MKRMVRFFMRHLFRLIILVFLINNSPAQQVRYLNNSNGLSSRHTYGVEQDYKGFIWFATNEGIDRYDGNEFRNYTLHSSTINPTELGYRFNIVTDTSKIIWAYTTSGRIFRYNQFKDEFDLIFELQTILEDFTTIPYINKIFFDRQNIMWIGTTIGTYYAKVTGAELQWTHFYSKTPSFCFEESETGFVWAGTNEGVQKLYSKEILNNKDTDPDEIYHATKNLHIRSIFYDSQNKTLWIGSENSGPSVYNLNKNKWTDLSYLTPPIPIRSILKDSQGTILIGLDGAGIIMVDPVKFEIRETWKKSEDITDGLSDNSVLDIYCDAEDRIWVSTWSAGITILDLHKPKLKFIAHQFNNQNSIRSNQVGSIFEDSDGDLWFGTNSGVSKLNVSTGNWDHLQDLPNAKEISAFKILSICEDNKKRIWIGGYANGVHCYDKKSRTLTDYTPKIGISYIYCIFYDGMNGLWFGGMEGKLTKMDLRDESLTTYNARNVTVIINRNKEQLWVGTTSGLNLVDKVSGKVYSYPEFATGIDEISNKYINCLYTGSPNQLWIGTNGGGLNLCNLEKKQIDVFSIEDGLPSNFIYGIFSDNKGRIWLSTEKGTGCFDPVNKKSINIGYIEKFTNFPFNQNAHAQMKTGEIIFGGLNGALIFSPENILSYKGKSKLVLNEFWISYHRVLPGDKGSPLFLPVDQVSETKLRYNQNSFSFRFSSINFDNADQFVYQWKLQGFDTEWTPLTANRTAGYTNIPPGKYIFKIRTVNRNDLLTSDERQIFITISPPLWKTKFAFVFYFILVSGIVFLLYSMDQNRLQKKHSADKIKFFISTAHDIKTPVSLIKAPLKDLEADKGLTAQGLYYLKLAQSNADRLSQVVNQVLDFDKIESKKTQMAFTFNNLNAYLQEKMVSYKLLAEDKELEFNYSIPDYSINVMFDVAKMDKIIDNLFSNAIKYTLPGGMVSLAAKMNAKEWTIEISDTGIGIPKKEQKNLFRMYYRAANAINSRKSGTGIGLMLVENLVKLHGGSITFTSLENKGTSFLLSFPIKSPSGKSEVRTEFQVHPSDDIFQNINSKEDVAYSIVSVAHESQTKILVVEDEKDLRNYLVSTLSQKYYVYCAEDGEEAYNLVEKEKFDLIISDVMMPKMKGDELCRKIKGNIDTSHIPVILLTALSDKDNTISGFEAGADNYISKPFDIGVIHASIDSILRNRRLISESLLKGIEPSPEKVFINNLDQSLIKNILAIVEKEISNPDFSISDLCRETAMSRTLLYEKIKAHTNLAPNEFIRIIRMNKAMDFLKTGKYSINEIADHVGFQDSKYFSTAFKKFFGKSPKHYHNKP